MASMPSPPLINHPLFKPQMELTNNKLIGEYLGYPSCCIEAFGDPAPFYFMRPQIVQETTKNAFMPCSKCAKMLKDGAITYDELINGNRSCTIPFKEVHTEEEERQIDEELDILTS